MLASTSNRTIEDKEGLKFVDISGQNLKDLANKLKVNLSEKLQSEGAIFIGPETMLHYQTIAQDLGLDTENLSEEQIEIFKSAKYTNAGHLLRLNGKSLITGTSMTLSNNRNIRFASLEGTDEKHKLDTATQNRLNEIYAGTWEFTVE